MTRVLALLMLALVGCTKSTEYGKCIGLNGTEDPKLVYHYSAWNIGMGVIFFTLVVPPIVVVLDELKCPVEKKVEINSDI